jgi:hypothetical protein
MTRVIAIIVAYIWVLSSGLLSGGQRYDCALASFHPDYPQAVREACRRRG